MTRAESRSPGLTLRLPFEGWGCVSLALRLPGQRVISRNESPLGPFARGRDQAVWSRSEGNPARPPWRLRPPLPPSAPPRRGTRGRCWAAAAGWPGSSRSGASGLWVFATLLFYIFNFRDSPESRRRVRLAPPFLIDRALSWAFPSATCDFKAANSVAHACYGQTCLDIPHLNFSSF